MTGRSPTTAAEVDDAVAGPRGAPDAAPPEPRPSQLGNRPPLTGLRALAVGVVVVFHSNFRTMPGAWVGPQVFFVLSGFLITSLLTREGRRSGRISLPRFYARRTTRLLPPLLVTIGVVAVYALFVHVADAAHRLWGDSLAAVFYFADYRQAFGHAPFFGYLAQTWSLSVEEQFYVVWSVAMVAAVATGWRKLAYTMAIAGLVASIADRLYFVYHAHHVAGHAFDPVTFVRAYYAFDTRADALLIGCLLGLLATDGYLDGWGRRARAVVTVAAVASGAFLVWIVFEAPLFTENLLVWWLPLTSLAGAVLITYFVVCPGGIGAKLMGIGILVFIGELSYTIYLVHFPVFLALGQANTHWSFWPLELVRLAIVFGIAIFSWYAIERPLTRWRHRSAGESTADR